MRASTEILFPGLHATKTGHRNCHGNSAVPGRRELLLVFRLIQSNVFFCISDMLALKANDSQRVIRSQILD